MVDPVAFTPSTSGWWIFSMTIMVKSPRECPGRLKWWATGFSSLLLVMSDLCSLRQMWRQFSVSPTYCFLHTFHLIRYLDQVLCLQMAEALTENVWPVTVLLKVVSNRLCWQVLQRLYRHALLPLCSIRIGLSSAFTSKSRRLRGHR